MSNEGLGQQRLNRQGGEGLAREMGLAQATAVNMLNMIGIGPFLTIPLILAAMGGPQAMLGWLLGLVLALSDGLVWAELGAAMPGTGGPYVYLREAFGRETWGRLLSFLFIWQVVLTAPLSAASAAIGFASYLKYFWPEMSRLEASLVAMSLCALVTLLLYRNIKSIGRLSVAMLVVVLLAVVWVIAAGASQFSFARAFSFPQGAFDLTPAFVGSLGAATLIAIYDYGGYGNICFLGGEVRNGARTIPRAVIISICVVALLYIVMTLGIIGVIPWSEAMRSTYIVSELLQRVHGPWAGAVITVLILSATFAALFALMLGYSRIPYAAALDGNFFRAFARVHPTERFPHVSVVVIGVASIVFCVFTLEAVIKTLVVIQIVIQAVAQIVAVTIIRKFRPEITLPFRMWLYPLPSVLALALWLFILTTSDWPYIAAAFGALVFGIALFLLRARILGAWPFGAVSPPPEDMRSL